jgi:hypothetical protein
VADAMIEARKRRWFGYRLGYLKAFQANITNYVVSLVAHCLGARLDLDRVWLQQGPSPQLQRQISTWAAEVNDVLHQTAGGRMISEREKKPECWKLS